MISLYHIPFFTDGSKEGNKVGYAVHTEFGDLTGALHGRASIFTAEARGLTRGVGAPDGALW